MVNQDIVLLQVKICYFLIEMVEITTVEPVIEEEPEENVTQDYNMTVTEVVDGDTFYLGNGGESQNVGN